MKRQLVLFAAFAVALTALDRVWVRLGVLVYPTAPGGQPWWVPPMFGAVAVVLVGACAWVTRRLLPGDLDRPEPRADAARAALWFAAAHVAAGLVEARAPGYAGACTAALAAAAWPRLTPERGLREKAIVGAWALGVALGGAAAEIALGRAGLMAYPRGTLAGVPPWLPAVWLHAALFARAISRAWFGGR